MGYPRTMGAGLAGSTTKIYGNANVNQIQYGDKLQGLPPVTGRRDPYRIYKTKAGGNAPGRFRVFCVNQLGGIGMANKNSQFAPNADGLGWCPNRKNSREGDIGINKADRGHDAIRFQSRADLKAEFEILAHGKGFRNSLIDKIIHFLLVEGQVTGPVGSGTELLRQSSDSKVWYWTARRLGQPFDIVTAAQPLIHLVSLQDTNLAAALEHNLHLLKRRNWTWGELFDNKPGGSAIQDLASLKPFSPEFEAFIRSYFDPLSDPQLQRLVDILYSSSTLENAIIGAVSGFPALGHQREILEADFSILLEFALKHDIVVNMDRILTTLRSLGVTEQAIQIVKNAYTRIKQEYASIGDVIDEIITAFGFISQTSDDIVIADSFKASTDLSQWTWTETALEAPVKVSEEIKALVDLVASVNGSLALALSKVEFGAQSFQWKDIYAGIAPGDPVPYSISLVPKFSAEFLEFMKSFLGGLSHTELRALRGVMYSGALLENLVIGTITKFTPDQSRSIMPEDFMIVFEFAIKYDIVINMDRILTTLRSLGVTEQTIQVVESAFFTALLMSNPPGAMTTPSYPTPCDVFDSLFAYFSKILGWDIVLIGGTQTGPDSNPAFGPIPYETGYFIQFSPYDLINIFRRLAALAAVVGDEGLKNKWNGLADNADSIMKFNAEKIKELGVEMSQSNAVGIALVQSKAHAQLRQFMTKVCYQEAYVYKL